MYGDPRLEKMHIAEEDSLDPALIVEKALIQSTRLYKNGPLLLLSWRLYSVIFYENYMTPDPLILCHYSGF